MKKFFIAVLLSTAILSSCQAITGPIYTESIVCIIRLFTTDSVRDPNNPGQWIYGDTIWLGVAGYSDDPRCLHNNT